MSKTTKTATRTRKTTTTSPAPVQVPFLLSLMGQMSMWDDNPPADLPGIVAMMPGYMEAVRARRTDEGPEQGVVSLCSIVKKAHEVQLARCTPDYQKKHSLFMATVGPMDIRPGLYGDEHLEDLRHTWGELGFFAGMAYAYYFMAEAGVIGGAR
jgi:hypothetical protein